MSCYLEFFFQTFPGGQYCSLYLDVLQLILGSTAAYIVTCDFNENPKSDFDFDLGFVKQVLNPQKGVSGLHSFKLGTTAIWIFPALPLGEVNKAM